MKMKRTLNALVLAAAVTATFALGASAQMMGGGTSNNNPMVGGAPMYRTKNIVENAMNSADHTTLVAAVKAAGLVGTLQGKGPFTVFAPTNDAFGKLPQGTVETLVRPENKATLTGILTYHVVAGKYDAKKIMQLIKKGRGQATLRTVSGGTLTARMNGAGVTLTDEKGGMANVTTANVYQSNGVIHVVDTVLMPR
ncbi:MAG: fasciclin domain-containing protein [Acidobacteria bacterium]|nr:fasciclin domain-containing protein [Acidobacteriota bacterium]